MHEEVLEAERVGAQAEPEKMALDAGNLRPDEAQQRARSGTSTFMMLSSETQ